MLVGAKLLYFSCMLPPKVSRSIHRYAFAACLSLSAGKALAQLQGGIPPPIPTTQDTGAKNSGSKTTAPSSTSPQAGQDASQGGDSKSVSRRAPDRYASGRTSHLSPFDPSSPPQRVFARPRIGLALGGGGALGLTEVGVLEWFEQNHIPVDVIAGTSMGCMVAALYSSGQSPDKLKTIMNDRVFSSIFTFSTSYASRSFRRREDARNLPNGIPIGLKHRASFRNAVLTDGGLNAFLDRQFLRFDDQTDFNTLPIPLRCISTDLNEARAVTFARGSIPDAVRASVSLPGVFQPLELDGHEYVDGGVLENLPTRTVRAMDADVVLAVSLPLAPVGKGDLDSLIGVLGRSFSVAIEGAERDQRKQANVVLMPDITGFTTTDYLKTIDLARRGYEAAQAQRSSLIPYALSDGDWSTYLTHRASLLRGPAGPVLRVRVIAPNESATRSVQRILAPLVNQPADTARIESLLDQVRADGRYEADYTVGYEAPQPAAGTTDSSPAPVEIARRPIILVTVVDKKTGPPSLLLGVNIQAQTTAVNRATIEGILLDQDLGSFGAELRTHVRLGYLTELSSEYFRPLNAVSSSDHTFFAAPHVELLRQPFSIYRHQVRLADRQLQSLGLGADLGWTNQRTAELRLGLDFAYIRWDPTIGDDAQPNFNGNTQRAHLRYSYDTKDRALVPQFGLRLITEAAYLYQTVGSPNTPQLYSQASYAHSFTLRKVGYRTFRPDPNRSHEVFVIAGEGGTMFHRNVAEPFRFTLGGPLRLSASAIDEYRGTDYLLIEPAVLRRIAKLPNPLGQSIYLGAAYEYGHIEAPGVPNLNRQDIFFGLVAETPLGVVTLAPAIGTNGERKFVFTLGKLF